MKKFNMNNIIKVRLNEKGKFSLKLFYTRNYSGVAKNEDIMKSLPTPDENGFYKFQLWEFMKIFGEDMGLGIEPPFDGSIFIDDMYLREEDDDTLIS